MFEQVDQIFDKLKDNIQLMVFLVTWFCSEVFLFVSIRLANWLHLHDNPNEDRKIHTHPVPTIGGVPIFMAFAVGIFFVEGSGWSQMRILMLGAFVCMLLGLIDDLKPIPATIKLMVLTGVTVAIFLMSQVSLTLAPEWLWQINLIISLIWIVGMMSAINSLDNMDGLAAGITAIACFFIFLIAWDHWQRWLSIMSVALFAGCLTFLKHNFFQARAGIFLGDNGSYCIGFILACMAMMGAWTNPKVDLPDAERIIKALIVPPLLLGVPIFDIVVATVLRLVNGEVSTVKEAIVYCGKDHTSHRLVALGFSRRQAVVILWGIGVGLGVVSLVIMNSNSAFLYLSLAAVTIAGLYIFALIINRAKVYDHQMTDSGAAP